MRIIGLAGWSGSGKTTLVSRVIPVLVARGLKVSTVKHAHKGFDIDIPGKDSHTHRMVGATEVFVASGKRWAHVHELRDEPEPDLVDILPRLTQVDLLIIEGFKRHRHPKLEIFRREVGKPLLHPEDDYIVALASDGPVPEARVPVLALDDIERIADVLNVEAMPAERLRKLPQQA
jgi:molybdopterin-guanine dinucleotide biosynthesis protein B